MLGGDGDHSVHIGKQIPLHPYRELHKGPSKKAKHNKSCFDIDVGKHQDQCLKVQ